MEVGAASEELRSKRRKHRRGHGTGHTEKRMSIASAISEINEKLIRSHWTAVNLYIGEKTNECHLQATI